MANITRWTKYNIRARLTALVSKGIIPKTVDDPKRTWNDQTIVSARELHIELPAPQTVTKYFGSLTAVLQSICDSLGVDINENERLPNKEHMLQVLQVYFNAAGELPISVPGGVWSTQTVEIAKGAGIQLPRPFMLAGVLTAGEVDRIRKGKIPMEKPTSPDYTEIPTKSDEDDGKVSTTFRHFPVGKKVIVTAESPVPGTFFFGEITYVRFEINKEVQRLCYGVRASGGVSIEYPARLVLAQEDILSLVPVA